MKTNPSNWETPPGGLDVLNARTLLHSDNQWGIPLIQKTEYVPKWLAPYKHRLRSSRELDLTGGAYHFFLPEERFKCVWERPSEGQRSISRLSCVLSPAFPLGDTLTQQMVATYKNRWCGAWWQSQGITVIPSLSWRGEESYGFAFAGVVRESVVAISAQNWREWPEGFDMMMGSLNPTAVLCFGEALIEMPEIVSYPVKFSLKLIGVDADKSNGFLI